MIKEKPELLAPAGSKDALIAAVENGADAVYLGGSSFSARASAQNFSNDELKWAVDYCHLRHIKVYVAINTLVSDRELPQLSDYIAFVNNIGCDAVIVQDIGVAKLAREIAPGLSLHASTQAGVHDKYGAVCFEKLGFKRVVIAREISAKSIEKIAATTDIELEMFVHGAICLCYSGQCLMSSFIGGRSGNRGKCAQPCRLLYKTDRKEGFLLSPKDMCLINHIAEIKKLGVKSLKIEGRMKGPDYVGTVTGIYRKYLDNDYSVSKEDYENLERIFYRGGFTDRYFTGEKSSDMFCHTKPDNPYKMQKGDIPDYKCERKTGIKIECIAHMKEPLKLKITDDFGNAVECEGDVMADIAINKPLSEERLNQQLSKLGDTSYYANDIKINIDDNISLPISEINSVRRKAIGLIEEKTVSSYYRNDAVKVSLETSSRKPSKKLEYAVQISDEKQLSALDFNDYEYLYVPLNIAVKRSCFTDKDIVVLPRISPVDLKEKLEVLPIKRALITNIGQILLLQELGFDIYVDYSINIFNTIAAKQFGMAKRITLSSELMLSQIRALSSENPIEVIAYGRIPLMITENCIIKSTDGCKRTNSITDRTGAVFPVRCVDGCRNEILNSKPVVMSDKLSDIKLSGINVIRLMFTTETADECRKILKYYKDGVKPDIEFTRGKFYKGV